MFSSAIFYDPVLDFQKHEFLIYNTLYMSNQFSTMFRTNISGTKIIKNRNKRISATLVITLSSPSIYPGLKRVWVWTGIHFLDIFLGWFKWNSPTCSLTGHKNITRNTIIFKSSLRCCQNLLSRSQVKIWLPIFTRPIVLLLSSVFLKMSSPREVVGFTWDPNTILTAQYYNHRQVRRKYAVFLFKTPVIRRG